MGLYVYKLDTLWAFWPQNLHIRPLQIQTITLLRDPVFPATSNPSAPIYGLICT